jgi:hypothetical protein
MAIYQVKDFADIVDSVMEELKFDSSDSTEETRIKRDINMVYLDEVVPFKRWKWLTGEVLKEHKPYLGVSTVSVTPDSTTITFAVAPSTSKTGYWFATDTHNEIYKISAHTAGATSATLTSPYTGALNATAAYKVWTDQINLPTDAREVVEVWHQYYKAPVEPRGLQEILRLVAESPKCEGRPAFYYVGDYEDPTSGTDETESDRYRTIKIYPSIYPNSTTLHINYTKEVSPLEDDGDEPAMPLEDRIVLVYGALSRAWARNRNPEEAARNQAMFENKLARMAGRTEDTFDKPTITPDSNYMMRKRGPRVGRIRGDGSLTGGSSYTIPSYLAGTTINGATITGNVTVSAGITIDGRDLSVDGTAMDAHIAATTGVHGATGSVVGTSDTQTLTNKTIDADSNTITNIENADIKSGAAISLSKLASLDTSIVAITNGSGVLASSAITATELTYLDDVAALTSVVLTDNTTNGTAVTLTATWTVAVLSYSVVRGAANLDAGHIYLINDGTNVNVAVAGASLGTTGVTFNGTISGSDVLLRYTTTSTGSDAALKYKLHKWSA